MEQIYALFILAWGLARSLLAPLLGQRRGLGDFRASYAADRLPPLSASERDLLPALGGCIACGLCDAGSAAGERDGGRAAVMDLMLASSRSMPDYDAAVRSFDGVSDAELAALERRCPTRVPMRKVAVFVREKAREVAGA